MGNFFIDAIDIETAFPTLDTKGSASIYIGGVVGVGGLARLDEVNAASGLPGELSDNILFNPYVDYSDYYKYMPNKYYIAGTNTSSALYGTNWGGTKIVTENGLHPYSIKTDKDEYLPLPFTDASSCPVPLRVPVKADNSFDPRSEVWSAEFKKYGYGALGDYTLTKGSANISWSPTSKEIKVEETNDKGLTSTRTFSSNSSIIFIDLIGKGGDGGNAYIHKVLGGIAGAWGGGGGGGGATAFFMLDLSKCSMASVEINDGDVNLYITSKANKLYGPYTAKKGTAGEDARKDSYGSGGAGGLLINNLTETDGGSHNGTHGTLNADIGVIGLKAYNGKAGGRGGSHSEFTLPYPADEACSGGDFYGSEDVIPGFGVVNDVPIGTKTSGNDSWRDPNGKLTFFGIGGSCNRPGTYMNDTAPGGGGGASAVSGYVHGRDNNGSKVQGGTYYQFWNGQGGEGEAEYAGSKLKDSYVGQAACVLHCLYKQPVALEVE